MFVLCFHLSRFYAKILFVLDQSFTLAALTAFTKLAINDGHKFSLHEQFDQELQLATKSEKFSEFKKLCFGLLGYTTAAVLYHMD